MDSGRRLAAGIAPRSTQEGRPSRWLVVAGILAIGWGALSIAFALLTWEIDTLVGSASWLLLLWPGVAIVSGVGVLRVRSWARLVAGGLAAFTLLVDASSLLPVPGQTALDPLRLLEIAGSLLMLYALVWHWPVARGGR